MWKQFLFGFMFLLVAGSTVYAGPAAPDVLDVNQPDGSKFKAKIHGDEFQNWVEAVDSGHTVINNKETGHWEYAEKQPDGSLKPSGINVDPSGQLAPFYIEKGVRPDRALEMERQHNESLRQIYNERLAPSFSIGSGALGEVQSSGPLFAPGDWVPTPVSGTRKVLIVLINFANRTLTTTADDWYHKVFDTKTGVKSVANYYKQNSFGKLAISPAFTGGSHPGVVAVTIADYHPNSGSSYNYATETTIISHALALAAATVNLSGFDITTGKVYFIYAGYENSGSAKTPNIWAHTWSGSVTGGSITITRWALSGELNNADVQQPMGVITHELGHALCGLPDLYDTSGYNAGLGNFSLMAGGSWGGSTLTEYHGTTPVALDAWSREYLRWTSPLTPVSSGPISLRTALSSANNAIKLINPSVSTTEYWLVENRYPAPGSWDEGIIGINYYEGDYAGGLLITHIDITAGTLGNNDINRYGIGPHQGVVPEQASTAACDMLASGSEKSCRGTAVTTFYSGNNGNFSTDTTPDSTYYSGAASNRGIKAISARGPTMTATVFSGFPAFTVATVTNPNPARTASKTISGTREANATITVTTDDGAPIGQISYPSATTWKCAISPLLAGNSSYGITATDAAGNTAVKKIVVIKVSPDLILNAVTTPTKIDSQTITGTIPSGCTVAVFKGSKKLGNVTLAENGTDWSFPVTGMTANTTNTYTIIATDSFSNTTSITAAIKYDTIAPTFTVAAVTNPNAAGTVTKIVKGTREANATINVTTGSGATIGQINTPTATTWNCIISTLPAGNSSYDITATDIAGNTSKKKSIIIKVSPVVSVNDVTTPTNNSSQVISGTVQPGCKAVVYKGAKMLGEAILVDATNWSYSITGLSANATNRYTITATDSYGNKTSKTASILYDTRAPALTIKAVTPTNLTSKIITGSKTSGSTITANSPEGVTCAFSLATTAVSTAWNCTVTGYGTGDTTIDFTATDAAGNSTTRSATITYAPI
jgi:M6 family metalloprotease-like protein